MAGIIENDGKHWFVARTRHGAEIGVRDRLASFGVEYFVPTVKTRGWRGRTVEKPVINCLIFIRATQPDALALACRSTVT